MKPKTTLVSTLAKAGGTTDWRCDHCGEKFSLFELNAASFVCPCGSTDFGKIVGDEPTLREK